MRTMKQLREISVEVLNLIKTKELTIEETFYVIELVRFFGIYTKIKADVEKELVRLTK